MENKYINHILNIIKFSIFRFIYFSFLILILVNNINGLKHSQLHLSNNKVPKKFPKKFIFGSTSSAYQIEGAWNRDGKGPGIWDTFTQNHPEMIKDRSNGNIAANSYDFFEKDIKALKEIGVDFYRFSISWSRVLPTGDVSSRNELGLQYYDNLINLLLKNDIEPMVTMYHFDLPQSLQDLGGWTNPLIIEYFVEYARLLLDRYGDRVKTWFTINEPHQFCILGYGVGVDAPMITTPGIGDYLCGHYALLAHARVYHMYKNDYFFFRGTMGIPIDVQYMFPKDPNNANDVAAVERSLQFHAGWFAHPIFSKTGDYPEVMRKVIDKNSIEEGHAWSRLPKFTKKEIELIKGSSDFFALNYYTSMYAEPELNYSAFSQPSWEKDRNIRSTYNDSWPVAASSWLRSVPEGLRGMLDWIKREYNNPDVLIAENGWSDASILGNDVGRIKYIGSHLQAILNAISIDGCNVVGYTYWSIIDNFQWGAGYTEPFGLYHVDFNSTEKVRTARASSVFFKKIIETGEIPEYDSLIICLILLILVSIKSFAGLQIDDNLENPQDFNKFPKNFIFGTASSAYQIEGAWSRNAKGRNIWDTMTQLHSHLIKDRSNGNIAANSHDFYEKDVKALKEIGVDFYRFSISWSRVLPNGDLSFKNELGLQYYDNLINLLLENNIEPMVTMYHFDLPEILQDLGGWTNPMIIDYFVQYARFIIDRFGDRVKTWFTFNEPHEFCILGYGTGVEAPLIATRGTGDYLCAHNVLLSHARVYHLYKNEYFYLNGSMGIVLDVEYMWPKDANNTDDVEAAERSLQFYVGWFAHPIFSKTGDYPDVMRKIIDKISIEEGHMWSRLPKFTKKEIEMIKGSSDFYGLNYYTGRYAESETNQSVFPHPSWEKDRSIRLSYNDSWPVAASSWLRSVPEGLRDFLNWIKKEYNNPNVIIAENGWSDNRKGDGDEDRIRYIENHLQAILNAIWIDECNVIGYTYWSLIDNFEWRAGYTEGFGLYSVDFNSPLKGRGAKPSSVYFKKIIQTGGLPKSEDL